MSASENRIYFLLQRAAHRLKTEADAALKEEGGLTTAQAAVMAIIAQDGPVTQKHIAETLLQRESAITAMAARLLKAGYITKARSETDSRAWELRVTEAGEQAMAAMRVSFGRINGKLDGCISPGEMNALARHLERILDAFEA